MTVHSDNSYLPQDADEASATRAELVGRLDRRFRLPLAAYFGRRVGSAAEAQDLTQDVFERLLKVLDAKPILNAEALVFRIAANLLRDRARRQRRRGVTESLSTEVLADFEGSLAVDMTPERVVLAQRTLEEVLAALEDLGERTRTIFYLYRFEHLKVREIGEIYGISPSGVEKQIAKALFCLTGRLQLDERG